MKLTLPIGILLKLYSFLLLISLCLFARPTFAQPINNDCNNALEINVGNNGYGTGTFVSDTINISSATMQAGETVPPSIFVAGQYQKSIWYKFAISTSRRVRVTLNQPNILIPSGRVGFSVYKATNCLPTASQVSTKLTPLETFGSTFHPCTDSGYYLIQVSSQLTANGPVFIELEVEPSTASYDAMSTAYNFGLLNQPVKHIIYDVECQSKESINETCLGTLPTANQYTKTSWHTFTTPNYFDYISFLVAAGNTAYFTNSTTQHIIGYKLYEGNAQTTPLSSLTLVDGCDTIRTNGSKPGYRTYRCGLLDTSKTYSLQLFFKHDFNASLRVGIVTEGIAKAKGPVAVTSMLHPDNALGNLPYGLTNRTDYFACETRHATNACGNTKLPNGVVKGGVRYNLSTYYTFTLLQSSNVNFSAGVPPGSIACKNRYLRLYSAAMGNNCTLLDTTSLYKEFYNDTLLPCLPAGNYTLQILGSEDFLSTLINTGIVTSNTSLCLYGNFGQPINLAIDVIPTLSNNNYSLYQPNAFEKINNFIPLTATNTYPSTMDTFGCDNAVLPGGVICGGVNYKKAMYREFVVTDSVSVNFTNLSPSFLINNVGMQHVYQYRLYRNDANALALAQNTWSNPDTFSGLIPYSACITNPWQGKDICLEPDTYTLATFGSQFFINKTDKPNIVISNFVTQHYSQATVENMGDIIAIINNPLGGTTISGTDYFSCRNNAITIAGIAPCNGATKAIYREFFLSTPSLVQISATSGMLAVFSGRLSIVGFAGLTNIVPCVNGIVAANCETLAAGWYTVVSYGSGSSYQDPFTQNYNATGVGMSNNLYLHITPTCTPPSFNRPYKAAINTVTNAPFVVQWNAAALGTAYPTTAAIFNFPTEHWNCDADTPFSIHPIVACAPGQSKVAYYVFSLTQESYLSTVSSSNQTMRLYKRDVRIDSLMFDTLTPIHPCFSDNGQVEFCRAQPGVYTLVVTGSTKCTSVAPKIYIDRTDYSRFDHAKNAYDFGNVPANSLYHNGKVGDVNPLHAGRAPSNDFFYCTTGARQTDPQNVVCNGNLNTAIYTLPDTNDVLTMPGVSKRNLWYTFQLSKPGTVSIKVDNKTANKVSQLPFAVYRSNVNGGLPFTQVVSNGEVDSTLLQGLSLTVNNTTQFSCDGSNVVTFSVPPCNFDTVRYYVLVDNKVMTGNPYFMRPNHQVEVSVKIDSVASLSTNYDYYIYAANIGALGFGTHQGATDNYTCATANTSYPTLLPICAQKTLWYKFDVNPGVIGTAKIRLRINNSVYTAFTDDFVLYKQLVANDSTATGLENIHLSSIVNYRQACVEQGTYYLVLTGCSKTNEDVFPELLIEPNVGDYCAAPVVAAINGAGTASATLSVDCHTIGTDYGEMATTLTCPPNALTENYKSSWFRVDVGGTDTLDLSIYISENTNATSSQIHYRMMTGNCGAMQEQSCVLDAQTQNTYQCIIPGYSYYIQVLTANNYLNNDPAFPTLGNITLHVNAVQHIDSCAPMTNCLVNANFIPSYDCNISDTTTFNNFSTYGTAMLYDWDFGYNGATSTAFNPTFVYPATNVATTYTVTLRVINTSCQDTAYSTQSVIIPPRPIVDLGNDTATCATGSTILLNATSYPGSTYLWQNNSTNAIFSANTVGLNTYYVAVTYQGCTARDSINIYISPLIAQPIDTILICDGQTFVTLDATRPFAGTTYLWNNNVSASAILVNTPSTHWVDVSLQGCVVRDSFVVDYNVDTLSVLGNDTAICHFANGYTLNATFPGAQIYLWQNNAITPQININQPGTYWVRVYLNGCAYTDTINIESLPLATLNVYDTVCYGGFYILPSADTAFATGLYQDTFAVANACDSVINTHLFVRDSIYSITFDTICANQFPVIWNGISIYNGGNNVAQFKALSTTGCDSTAYFTLTVHPTTSATINLQACQFSLPFIYLGNSYTSSGTYYDTVSNAHGCDSFITLNLDIVTEFRDTLITQICNGDSLVFYDSVYHTTGIYTHSFVSNSGCDSFKILVLQAYPTSPLPLVISPVGYCLNDAASPLSAQGTNLLWYTNSIGGIGSPNAPIPNTGSVGEQMFYVSQTINGCESFRDSIMVFIRDKPIADFSLMPQGDMCSADSALVTFIGSIPQGSTLNWNWDNGTATGAEPGPYKVTWNTAGLKTVKLWVDNLGCPSDTVSRIINIKLSPETPQLELPDYVCVFDTITLSATGNNLGAIYNWMYNNEVLQEGNFFTKTWTEPGIHYFALSLTANDCNSGIAKDSIIVIALPEAQIEMEANKICVGESLKLQASTNDDNTYKWTPSNYFPDGFTDEGYEVTALAGNAGWIYLNVTNSFNCINTDSIWLGAEHCCDLFLPNAFSPNNDGLNDIFIVQTESKQQIKEFAIFNRYGQRVFISHSQTHGWDGMYNGKPADIGVYNFYIKYICSDGTTYFKKGDLHLMR